jgi:hypothetical protein
MSNLETLKRKKRVPLDDKAKLKFPPSFQLELRTFEDSSTERLSLAHGFDEDGVKKLTLIHVRRYTPKGSPSTNGIVFRPGHLPFLLEHVDEAMHTTGEYREKAEIDGVTISVCNVHDRDENEQNRCVKIAWRKGLFAESRLLDPSTAASFVEGGKTVRYLLDQEHALPDPIYDDYMGWLLMEHVKRIDPLTERAKLLKDDKLRQKAVEDVFDYDGHQLYVQMCQLCNAFGWRAKTLMDKNYTLERAHDSFLAMLKQPADQADPAKHAVYREIAK